MQVSRQPTGRKTSGLQAVRLHTTFNLCGVLQEALRHPPHRCEYYNGFLSPVPTANASRPPRRRERAVYPRFTCLGKGPFFKAFTQGRGLAETALFCCELGP